MWQHNKQNSALSGDVRVTGLLRVRSRRTKAKEQQRKARVHVRQLGRKKILTALLVPATNRFRMYDDSKIKQLEKTTASYA